MTNAGVIIGRVRRLDRALTYAGLASISTNTPKGTAPEPLIHYAASTNQTAGTGEWPMFLLYVRGEGVYWSGLYETRFGSRRGI